MRMLLSLLVIVCGTHIGLAEEIKFKKQVLLDQFTAEGAHFADFDRDGHHDICAGPFIWKGPDFSTRLEYTAPSEKPYVAATGYSDYFVSYTYDFNSDGWSDILVYSWPGKETWVFENPQGKEGHWKRHSIFDVTDNESPTLGDMNGDGKPELICHTSDGNPKKKSGGRLGYAEIDWKQPFAKARFHPITPVTPENDEKYFRYTHGYGYGDINGDGRPDLLTKEGWFAQPKDGNADDLWQFHDTPFAPSGARGGSFMLVYDVNGDGRNDVITAHDAHGFGFSWYEQKPDGQFSEHRIMGSKAEDNPYGVKFSQLHAMQLADFNNDGILDVVTGKRRWAHGPQKDEEPMADPVLYWFEIRRDGKGNAEFIPHLIDSQSGVGTQVTAGDINRDGKTDVVVANKLGVFVHLQQ